MFTLAELQPLFPRAAAPHLEAFVAAAPGLFRRYRLDASRQRMHFFLAQLGHESDGLRLTEENLHYSAARMTQVWPSRFPSVEAAAPFARDPEKLANHVYGGRMGNDRPGDGWRFRGRGYIQLTGREAYRLVGRHAGLDLEGDPDLAATPEHALAVAGGFWMWKRLNPLADQGNFTDLTKRINGGLIGLQDRFHWLEKVQRALPMPDPGPLALDVPKLKQLQQALKARGLYSGSIDGIIGSRSLAGIATLRAEEGLPAGGGIDRALLEILDLA